MNDTAFWRIWHSLFPARVEPYLRFKWMVVVVAALGIVNLTFKLLVKLPPEILHQVQSQESLVRTPWFLICYNIILALGFWTVYRTRHKLRFTRSAS